jgi:hypothetical protein
VKFSKFFMKLKNQYKENIRMMFLKIDNEFLGWCFESLTQRRSHWLILCCILCLGLPQSVHAKRLDILAKKQLYKCNGNKQEFLSGGSRTAPNGECPKTPGSPEALLTYFFSNQGMTSTGNKESPPSPLQPHQLKMITSYKSVELTQFRATWYALMNPLNQLRLGYATEAEALEQASKWKEFIPNVINEAIDAHATDALKNDSQKRSSLINLVKDLHAPAELGLNTEPDHQPDVAFHIKGSGKKRKEVPWLDNSAMTKPMEFLVHQGMGKITIDGGEPIALKKLTSVATTGAGGHKNAIGFSMEGDLYAGEAVEYLSDQQKQSKGIVAQEFSTLTNILNQISGSTNEQMMEHIEASFALSVAQTDQLRAEIVTRQIYLNFIKGQTNVTVENAGQSKVVWERITRYDEISRREILDKQHAAALFLAKTDLLTGDDRAESDDVTIGSGKTKQKVNHAIKFSQITNDQYKLASLLSDTKTYNATTNLDGLKIYDNMSSDQKSEFISALTNLRQELVGHREYVEAKFGLMDTLDNLSQLIERENLEALRPEKKQKCT